jgi:predicted metal-dependent peptidase
MADEGDREEVTRELLDEVEAGLVDDRRALLIKMPFIGSILMHLDLEARAGMEMGTAATDGSTIMFDPLFYKKLKPEERLFVLAHEAWHCALLHFARTGTRHPEVANIAQDLEIHFVLMDELAEAKMSEPFVLPHDPAWKGLPFEEIYEKLIESGMVQFVEGDGEGGGGGGSQGDGKRDGKRGGFSRMPGGGRWVPGRESDNLRRHGHEGFDERCKAGKPDEESGGQVSDAEMRRRVETMREAIAQAAISVERKKGSLPGYLQTIVDKVVKPQLNWKMLLRRFVTSAYGGSRRWLPPSRRHVWQGLYLQSMRGERLKACVAVDTSGSCGGDLPQFFSELGSLLGTFGNYEITVIQCDAAVGRVEKFTSDRPLPKDYAWKVSGGGGTSFIPVFDYLKAHGMRPDVLVYVTDGYGDAPKKAPPYPVLWVLTSDGTEDFAAWGQKIHLNASDK